MYICVTLQNYMEIKIYYSTVYKRIFTMDFPLCIISLYDIDFPIPRSRRYFHKHYSQKKNCINVDKPLFELGTHAIYKTHSGRKHFGESRGNRHAPAFTIISMRASLSQLYRNNGNRLNFSQDSFLQTTPYIYVY